MTHRCRHNSWTVLALAASAVVAGCATQPQSPPPWQVPSYGSGSSSGSYSPYYRSDPYGYGYRPGYGYPEPYYGQPVPYPGYGAYYAYPAYPGHYCRDDDRDGRCDQAEKKQGRDDHDRDDRDRPADRTFGKRPFKDLGRANED